MKLNYNIITDEDKDGIFIKIVSLENPKNFTKYRNYFHVDNNGINVSRRITRKLIPELIESIKKKGITEGFILKDIKDKKINPENIIHKTLEKEINFTSTGDKLYFHWPIFEKLKDTNFSSIIRATLTLHQVCSSRCQFCSTINRNKKDSITLDEAKEFVSKLYFDQEDFNKKNFKKYNDQYTKITGSSIRLRSLILSGGGQPNLWPYFEEFVNWLSELDIDLGLITNGFPKNINDKTYDHFKWIRLSITPEDASAFYPNQKFNLQRIPKNIIDSKITFGLSYVYGPWTNDDILSRIVKTSNEWRVEYVRLLTDCNLGRTEQLKAHKALSEKLISIGAINFDGTSKSKIFHQLKYHGTQEEANRLWEDGKCFLQTYNVFWDTTGHENNGKSYCYPCDSVTVLTDENSKIDSERKFNSSIWGTVTNDKIEDLYKKEWKKYFDTRKNCSACLFMKNNLKVKELVSSDRETLKKIDLSKKIKHVNFP